MRSLFYVDALPDVGAVVVVDGDEGHHAATVRRTRVGEELDLSDGAGTLAQVVVEEAAKGRLAARVLAVTSQDGGTIWVPSGGSSAASRPCSAALFSLNGMAAAVASTSALCSAAKSSEPCGGALDAELSELRAAEALATLFLSLGEFLRDVAMGLFSCLN
mgnify:CR=1 FL=1